MDSPTLRLVQFDDCAASAKAVRGVGWVLEWAAALAVLSWAAVVLVAFAYQLAAERALSRAVAAGLREAACERATQDTVEAAVRHQLANRREMDEMTQFTLHHNGSLVRGIIHPSAGDRIAITLSAPVSAAQPAWLRGLLPNGTSGLTAGAEVVMIGQ